MYTPPFIHAVVFNVPCSTDNINIAPKILCKMDAGTIKQRPSNSRTRRLTGVHCFAQNFNIYRKVRIPPLIDNPWTVFCIPLIFYVGDYHSHIANSSQVFKFSPRLPMDQSLLLHLGAYRWTSMFFISLFASSPILQCVSCDKICSDPYTKVSFNISNENNSCCFIYYNYFSKFHKTFYLVNVYIISLF